MILLYYWGRWHFFFLKVWSYSLCGKWKMVFLKEKTKTKAKQKKMKLWYFLQMFWKDGLFKKSRRNMIFLVLSGKMVFFQKDDLSQKIHGNMIFSVYTCKCYKHGVTPPVIPHPQPKKNQGWCSPAKIHLRVVEVLDWHPRKNSNNSSVFYSPMYYLAFTSCIWRCAWAPIKEIICPLGDRL